MTRSSSPLGAGDLAGAGAWVFDLDNTLYPASSGLFNQIDLRMRSYIADLLDLEPDQASRVQKSYFEEYGTTLRGLMVRHGIEPRAFLDYVHDIDLAPVPPSPALAGALGRLDGRLLVFTNGTTGHAERIMERLGVGHLFESVFDIEAAGYVPKPDPGVYRDLVARFRLDPRRTVMVEDIARNLVPAATLGMTTVWVSTDSRWGREGADGDHVHHVAEDLTAWLEGVVGNAEPLPRGCRVRPIQRPTTPPAGTACPGGRRC